jgi:hypothetical protein
MVVFVPIVKDAFLLAKLILLSFFQSQGAFSPRPVLRQGDTVRPF